MKKYIFIKETFTTIATDDCDPYEWQKGDIHKVLDIDGKPSDTLHMYWITPDTAIAMPNSKVVEFNSEEEALSYKEDFLSPSKIMLAGGVDGVATASGSHGIITGYSDTSVTSKPADPIFVTPDGSILPYSVDDCCLHSAMGYNRQIFNAIGLLNHEARREWISRVIGYPAGSGDCSTYKARDWVAATKLIQALHKACEARRTEATSTDSSSKPEFKIPSSPTFIVHNEAYKYCIGSTFLYTSKENGKYMDNDVIFKVLKIVDRKKWVADVIGYTPGCGLFPEYRHRDWEAVDKIIKALHAECTKVNAMDNPPVSDFWKRRQAELIQKSVVPITGTPIKNTTFKASLDVPLSGLEVKELTIHD